MRFIAFIKKWTLPVAMATGVALYLIFSQIEQLDDAARFFNGFFSQIVPVMLFFVLFFTFCNVDFKQMRLTRWHLWILIIQVVLVAVAVAVVKIFNFGGSQLVLAQNLLTCIIAPGATAAPVVTAKLGGNVATMTAYTYLSNFLAALLIPLVFPLVGDCIDMGFLP
ncbi:MAG: transporter, partial [Muribaculaceae bacterium]|nr:transporter [Muribaculaceae bacterium]